jgi:hypothetical protein
VEPPALIEAGQLWNPYDFANPVDDEALFAGRETELIEIRYYLRQAARAPRPINLVLTGERSSGKTSLLNKIEHESRSFGLTSARVDLNEGDADPLAFFYKVYDAILLSAVTNGAFAGVTGQTYRDYRRTIDGGDAGSMGELLFPAHYSAASAGGRVLSEPSLKIDLRKITTEVGHPCVVLFDECDVLAKSRIALQMLRNVFMNTPGYMLVFAGTPRLFPVMEDIFSPIVRQFKKVPVSNFSSIEDTRQCIRKPLSSLGIDPRHVLPESAGRLDYDVHRLSRGRPYEIQLLCHFMFRRIEERRAKTMDITIDVLDDVRRELEMQESGSGRRTIAQLRLLPQQDLRLLAHLAEFRGSIEELWHNATLFRNLTDPFHVLDEAASRFIQMGFFQQDESGVVQFSGDQFDEVYTRYFAAAREVQLFVGAWPFAYNVDLNLTARLSTIEGVRILALAGEDDTETRARLEEALAVLTTPAGHLSALPDLAVPLYPLALVSVERGSLTLGLVRLVLAGNTVGRWIALSGPTTEVSLKNHPAMVEVAEKVGALGGCLTVTLYDYPLPSREVLLENAARLASPAQRDEMVELHVRAAWERYGEGDFQRAALEARAAYSLVPSAHAGTMVAHLSLLIGEVAVAIDSARDALELARTHREAYQEALAGYDHGAALLLGRRGEAGKAALTAVLEVEADLTKPALLIVLEWNPTDGFSISGDREIRIDTAAKELLDLADRHPLAARDLTRHEDCSGDPAH